MKEEQKISFHSNLSVSFAFYLAHAEHMKSIPCIGDKDFYQKLAL